jgi:hypothetical protein
MYLVGYLHEYYHDARSLEHKVNHHIFEPLQFLRPSQRLDRTEDLNSDL